MYFSLEVLVSIELQKKELHIEHLQLFSLPKSDYPLRKKHHFSPENPSCFDPKLHSEEILNGDSFSFVNADCHIKSRLFSSRKNFEFSFLRYPIAPYIQYLAGQQRTVTAGCRQRCSHGFRQKQIEVNFEYIVRVFCLLGGRLAAACFVHFPICLTIPIGLSCQGVSGRRQDPQSHSFSFGKTKVKHQSVIQQCDVGNQI